MVGSGPEATFRLPDGATELAARRLARWLDLPHRPIPQPLCPDAQLSQLHATPGRWLASLPLDPGQDLPDGRTWAEALGAWRQPTLLVIGAQQLTSGAAACTTALLRQWRVPLLGLVQWGGAWQGERRRRDGLPWLGRLEEATSPDDGNAADLVERLARRWTSLDLA